MSTGGEWSKPKTAVIVAAIVLASTAALMGGILIASRLAQAHDNSTIVKAYCSGAVSEAQYRGCLSHVDRARVDRLANAGDPTAIKAESADCSDGDAWQDGDC